MKKLFFILISLFLLMSSCNSKEDAIDRFMFENLYDYESYQPISFRETIKNYIVVKFRCKSAGGISKINEWEFVFNDSGEIDRVYDNKEEDVLKRRIYDRD